MVNKIVKFLPYLGYSNC